MKFIDTHIHLQDFNDDFALPVLNNAEAERLLLIAASAADFTKIAALMERFPAQLNGAFGIHPWYWREEAPLEMLKQMLKKFPQALVGEIGVDELKESVTAGQHQLFSAQLDIAAAFARPVVVHAAKAFSALVEHEAELKKVKFGHHGYVKNRELLKFINRCNGYVGLGALFLKQEKAAELWQDIPLNRILFETDAPYRVKEADYLPIVQENLFKLSAVAQMPAEELAAQLRQNAEEFMKC